MISHPFPYRIIRSSRKTLAIQVSVSGQVTVRAPHTMPDSTIHRFLSQKESWILEHLSHAATEPAQPQLKTCLFRNSAAVIIWNPPEKYSKEKPQPTPEKWA